MSFLDNSGDIILDAVLTDAGRARLARGDGSFKIVKYAFADDEIDYSKYNKEHASGSAYFDIDILTTPVLEALTNNTSTMKNRLLSIPKTNLLFLPILQINQKGGQNGRNLSQKSNTYNAYNISVNAETDQVLAGVKADPGISTTYYSGNGVFLSNTDSDIAKDDNFIQVDQGLDTTSIAKNLTIDPTLKETQYIVEIDNRLGSIATKDGNQQAYSFLDDDNIASYSFSLSSDDTLVSNLPSNASSDISGPRGTRLRFRVKPSMELESSDYYFNLLGTQDTIGFNGKANQIYKRIDSNVRITGATTGYRLNIPIVFLKWVSAA